MLTLELLLCREAFLGQARVPVVLRLAVPCCFSLVFLPAASVSSEVHGNGGRVQLSVLGDSRTRVFWQRGFLTPTGEGIAAAVTVIVHSLVSQLPCCFWIRALRFLFLLQPPPWWKEMGALHRAVPPTACCQLSQGSQQNLGYHLPYSCQSGGGLGLTSVWGRHSS